MKPPEILGMLEEAAGTRMYEMKKDAALRTLEKKQVKVEEINAVRACLRGTLTRVLTQRSRLQASLDEKGTADLPSQLCTPVRVCLQGGLSFRRALSLEVSSSSRERQVLKEEILPALERLRREKGQFLEWQAAGASIERLRRFCVAYRLASTERCARAPAGAAPAPAPRAACKC